MRVLNVVVTNKIIIEDKKFIGTGNVNSLKCACSFDESWDNLDKVATFEKNGLVYKRALVDDECLVPNEVLETAGVVCFGVYGYELQGEEVILRKSPLCTEFVVFKGSYKEGQSEPSEVNPTEYEVYIKTMNEIKAETEAIKDDILVSVDEKIADIDVSQIEGLASKEYVDEKLSEIEAGAEVVISTEEPSTEEWKLWVDENEESPEYITNEVDDLVNYYSKTEVDEKISNIEPPSIEGFATEEYVNEQISAIEIPSIEGLATEEYVNERIDAIDIPSAEIPEEVIIGTEEPTTEDWKLFVDENEEDEECVLKTEIESEVLENSTNPVSGGAVKTYVDENIRNIEMPSVEGFATEEYVQEEIAKV